MEDMEKLENIAKYCITFSFVLLLVGVLLSSATAFFTFGALLCFIGFGMFVFGICAVLCLE